MKPFEESDRYIYDLSPESVVLDCGGYKGDFAAGIYTRYGCEIHVFEPILDFYWQIEKRFEKHDKIHVHNFGVCAVTRGSMFYIKGDMTGEHCEKQAVWESVQLVEIAGILRLIPGQIDLIKLNIEGGEFGVLTEMVNKNLMKRFHNIQVQWHDVVPAAETLREQLIPRLQETHHLTFDHGWVWQNWRLNGL